MRSKRYSRAARSILIVDDDKMASEVMGSLMRRKFPDVTIHLADNGMLGLRAFKKYMPEVVITDINMPEMDGIQMASSIKMVKDDVHFFVMTGNSDQGLWDDFSRIGFDAYLMKPIDLGQLFAGVELCLTGLMKSRPVCHRKAVKKRSVLSL